MNDIRTVNIEKAIELSCACVHPLSTELVALEKSLNRVAANNVICQQDVPSFHRSLVDGFTLTELDRVRLVQGDCLKLKVIHVIAAGSNQEVQFSPGQTVSIMTGAAVPDNTAAIIKQEDVCELGEYIKIKRTVRLGENIEPSGSDIRAGKLIVSKGQSLDPGIIERLAAAGEAGICLYTIPRVYIINCGSELGQPGDTLLKGQIYNSNHNLILAQVQGQHCIGITGRLINDELHQIAEEIEKGIRQGDLLLISGGTSQGKFDLVADALEQLGAKFLFQGIESQPGRNVSCSLLNNRLVINLPGRPSAGGIIFDLLVAPILRKIRGLADYNHHWLNLALSEDIVRKCTNRSFCRGELIQKGNNLLARPLAKNEISRGKIPLLIDLKPGQGNKGDMVKATLIND